MIVGVLVMIAAGCSGVPDANQEQTAAASVGGVALTAARTGRQVRLTLANDTASAIGYNLCSSRLMRLSQSSWTNVPTGVMCTMEIRSLQPGASDHFDHDLPAEATAGEYRFETRVEIPMGSGGTQLTSSSFVVP